jgi:hypothetical protein
MAKTKFPETLQITRDPNSDPRDDLDFLAFTAVEPAIDEDGPTDIAEYKLVRVRKFRKDAVECK